MGIDGPSVRNLQDVFRASGIIGAWDWDVGADRVYADAGVFDLFDLTRSGPLAGFPMEQIMRGIYPEDRQRVRRQRQKSMESGEAHVTDFRTRRPDGTLRTLRGRGRCIYDKQGRATRFIGVTIDISRPDDEDKITTAGQGGAHPLELIADQCMTAHEIAERNGYDTLAFVLRMAMIEIGTSLAALDPIFRLDS